jgi:hypothetical protein
MKIFDPQIRAKGRIKKRLEDTARLFRAAAFDARN